MPSSDTSIESALTDLRNQSPREYGIIDQYCSTLKHAIETTDLSYAYTAQLYENIPDDASIDVQPFGRGLALLADLDVISIRNNAKKKLYNLTTYDEDRMTAIKQHTMSVPDAEMVTTTKTVSATDD